MKEKNGLLCNEWERRRRDRLNTAFKALAQLLPHYDPAKLQPKIDILEESTQFVKELRLSNSRLLNSQTQSAEMASKIRELQDEVNKLILRVKQLTKLLLEAKIPIPSGPSVKLLLLGKRRRLKQISSNVPVAAEDLENAHKVNDLTPAPKSQEVIGKDNAGVTDDINDSGKEREDNDSDTNVKDSPFPKTKIIILDSGYCPNGKDTGSGPLRETNAASDQRAPTANPKPTPTPAPASVSTVTPTTPTPVISLPNNYVPTLPTIFLTQCPPQPQPLVFTVTRPQEQPQTQPRILPKFTLVNSNVFQMPKLPILPIRKATPPKPKFTRRRRRQNEPKKSLTSTSQTQTQAPDVDDEAVKDTEPEIECITLSPGLSVSTPQSEKPETANDKHADENDGPTAAVEAGSPIPSVIQIPDDEAFEPESLQEAISEVAAGPEENTVKAGTMQSDVATQPEEHTESNTDTVTDATEAKDLNTEQKLTEPSNDATRTLETQPESEAPAGQKSETRFLVPVLSNSKTSSKTLEVLNSSVETAPELMEGSAVETVQIEATAIPVVTPEAEAEATTDSVNDLPCTPIRQVKESSRSLLDEACLSSDKISECIARSIDLIEHPENELMDLSGDWGSHSPKSPISPTQMFLSMFPLLPRESFVTVASESQQQHKNSSRSSFYINSMLPDPDDHHHGHSTSIQNLEPEIQFRTLTSVSASSSSTCLAMTPLTPVVTCTKIINKSESSLDSSNKVLAPLQNYKEKRTSSSTSEAVFASFNEPSTSRSANKTRSITTSPRNSKSSTTKKFSTDQEPPSCHDFQQPNFFPYTPIPNIDSHAQPNPISQFFNSFTSSNTAQYVQSAPSQQPPSIVAVSNRQTDFDFNFRQTQYPYQNQDVHINPQQQEPCATVGIRQNAGSKVTTNFQEPYSASHKVTPASSETNKSQSELFRPAPNVFLSNAMKTNTGAAASDKQQHHKSPRETQACPRTSMPARVCLTKASSTQQPMPPTSSNAGDYTRHHQHHTSNSTASYSQETQYQTQKQAPRFQPQSRSHLPIPIQFPSQIPVFQTTAATTHKPPATGHTMELTVDPMNGTSRPSIAPPIPAPDFSYSNQNYHTGDTNYFHDHNTRSFYQAYPNAPVTVTNTNPKPVTRAAPYYLPEPPPVPADAPFEKFHGSHSSTVSQPPPPATANAKIQGQGQDQGHFPQNSNFFPTFYNTHVQNPSKECPTHQNQVYNPVASKTSTQEYFQYPTSNTGSDSRNTLNSQQHQHHRPPPPPPVSISTTTPKPSPKKALSTPTMNYRSESQSQQHLPQIKQTSSVAGPVSHPPSQQQRPVNWMTDNSTYKKGSTVVSNPFSVSKLVGSGSQSHSGGNYCAEALIRKNNTNWNDFQFGSNSDNSSQQPQPQFQFQGTPQPFLPQSTQQPVVGHYSASSFSHQHQHHQPHQQYNTYSRNFNQFNTSQHQQQSSADIGHQPQDTSSSSTVNPQGSTTSISNFNLSSIFPEINDKGSKSASSSNNCNNYFVNRK